MNLHVYYSILGAFSFNVRSDISIIHFNYLRCNGLEHRITECQYDKRTVEDKSIVEDNNSWGAYCYIGSFT